jgi:hypothetical protein
LGGLGRLGRAKVLCERVRARLRGQHGRRRGRCRWLLLRRLRLERRVRGGRIKWLVGHTKWLVGLWRRACKRVGRLACGGALLGIRGGRCRRERGACLLVHEHRLAERIGGLLWSLKALEARSSGVLEAGD